MHLTPEQAHVGARVLAAQDHAAWASFEETSVLAMIAASSRVRAGTGGEIVERRDMGLLDRNVYAVMIHWQVNPPLKSAILSCSAGHVHGLMYTSDGGPVCDFCISEAVQWTYPCQDFEGEGSFNDVHYKGEWDACDRCASLIEHGNYGALAERVAFRSRQRGLPGPEAELRRLYDLFKKHRTGPRQPA